MLIDKSPADLNGHFRTHLLIHQTCWQVDIQRNDAFSLYDQYDNASLQEPCPRCHKI